MRKFLLFGMLLITTSIFCQIPDSIGITLPWDSIYVESYSSSTGAIPTSSNASIIIQEPAVGYLIENNDTTEMIVFYPILDFGSGVEYNFVQSIKVDDAFTLYTGSDVIITYDELPIQLAVEDLILDADPTQTYSFDPNDESLTVINYDASYLNQGNYKVFVYNHNDRSVGEVNVTVTDCEDYAVIDVPATATVEFDGESLIALTTELLGINIFYPCAEQYDIVLKHNTFENVVSSSFIGETINVEVVFNGVVQPESILVSITGEGAETIPMYIEEKTFTAGEEITLDVWSDQLDGLLSFQLRLNFENAQILDLTEGSQFDDVPHNIFNNDKTINSLWIPFDVQPIDVASNETWFTITVLPSVDGSTFDIFTTGNDPWSEIVIEDSLDITGITADFNFEIEERNFLVSNVEVENNKLLIHNNPTVDRLVVSGFTQDMNISKISILSFDGSLVMVKPFDKMETKVDLDVTTLHPGVYFLNLDGANPQTIKFVKM